MRVATQAADFETDVARNLAGHIIRKIAGLGECRSRYNPAGIPIAEASSNPYACRGVVPHRSIPMQPTSRLETLPNDPRTTMKLRALIADLCWQVQLLDSGKVVGRLAQCGVIFQTYAARRGIVV
jgi:hypothetical protein